MFHADVAQLVEHHLAKVDVASSNLVVRSQCGQTDCNPAPRAIGAAVARFPDTEEVTGSIPVSPTDTQVFHADVAQLVEHHLAKVDVASSNLVVRSTFSFGPFAVRMKI